ncbi:MAG: hypothetical protein JXR94_10755 [Candidatus Hydrogenedentes bacterium]|nr:hypothetical protein [Candidatus Hydrogenedentota bacterium]
MTPDGSVIERAQRGQWLQVVAEGASDCDNGISTSASPACWWASEIYTCTMCAFDNRNREHVWTVTGATDVQTYACDDPVRASLWIRVDSEDYDQSGSITVTCRRTECLVYSPEVNWGGLLDPDLRDYWEKTITIPVDPATALPREIGASVYVPINVGVVEGWFDRMNLELVHDDDGPETAANRTAIQNGQAEQQVVLAYAGGFGDGSATKHYAVESCADVVGFPSVIMGLSDETTILNNTIGKQVAFVLYWDQGYEPGTIGRAHASFSQNRMIAATKYWYLSSYLPLGSDKEAHLCLHELGHCAGLRDLVAPPDSIMSQMGGAASPIWPVLPLVCGYVGIPPALQWHSQCGAYSSENNSNP